MQSSAAKFKSVLAKFPGVKAILQQSGEHKAAHTTEREIDMPTITKLREERNDISRKMTALVNDTPRDQWNASKQREFTDAEAAIVAIDGQIDRHERALAAVAERLHGGVPANTSRGDLHNSVRALGQFAMTGDRYEFGMQNSMTESGDAGIIVPHELYTEITRLAQKYSPLRPLCKVINIGTAASKFTLPVATTGASGAWVGETDARPETAAPTLADVQFNDSELYYLVPLSQWLLEDTQVGTFLTEEIAAGIGRAEGKAILSGSGTKQPQGVLTATMAGTADGVRAFGSLQTVNTGDAAAITADSLISLLYALAPEYRQNCNWVLNSNTLSVVRRLKDSNGQYLWAQGIAAGQPQTLLGYPVCECGDMPDIGADATPVIVGDWMRGYALLDRTMTVLRDPYSAKPMVQVYTRKRVSGAVVDSCALKVLKVAA